MGTQVKKMYGVLAFISWDIWVLVFKSHVVAVLTFGLATFGVLCADLDTTQKKQRGGLGEGAEVIYQVDAWIVVY